MAGTAGFIETERARDGGAGAGGAERRWLRTAGAWLALSGDNPWGRTLRPPPRSVPALRFRRDRGLRVGTGRALGNEPQSLLGLR